MSERKGIRIKLFGKEFHIQCPDGNEQHLLNAAQLLEDKMHKARNSSRVHGFDHLMTLSALNLAHDYLQLQRQESKTFGAFVNKIQFLESKIANILKHQQSDLEESSAEVEHAHTAEHTEAPLESAAPAAPAEAILE